MNDTEVKKLAEVLKNANNTYVLTGAGMSTESGIPDFRSQGTGLWNEIDPIKYATRDVLMSEPEKFFQVTFKRFASLVDKKPNEGHYVLSELEKEGIINGIITQNIDGLHQEAGSKEVWEVHGNIKKSHCMECNTAYPFEELVSQVEIKDVPECKECGGVIRPDVVLFGDPMPDDFFEIAAELKQNCDFLLIVGTSLQVYPVAGIAELGVPMGIINLDSTPHDVKAKAVINTKCSQALKQIKECL